MKNKIVFRVYNISDGLSMTSFEENFNEESDALHWINLQPNNQYYMIVKCIPGQFAK